MLRRILGLFCLTAMMFSGGVRAQISEDPETQGLSRQMQTAVKLFEQGNDTEAMDKFMEVLVQGDPSERAIANDYLNRITQRFNQGAQASSSSNFPSQPRDSAYHPSAGVAETGRGASPRSMGKELPSRGASSVSREGANSQGAPERELPASDKERMRLEIETSLQKSTRFYEGQLRKIGSIRIVMADAVRPRALGIPTSLMFESGVVFTHEAATLLKSLTGLAFSLGGAQIFFLPEGSTSGDAKIQDMRRAMGIAAQLYSAGISPSRVQVNLLQSAMEIPKELTGFRGVIMLFLYDRRPALNAEHALGDETGPPISLGVFPENFRADKGEGSIIEFSVMDLPAKLQSWKFQLLQPGYESGGDLHPLQDVTGTGPVFHQIYWNGRKGYFGDILPPGRYEAVLTATDGRNRTRSLHAWITTTGMFSASPESAEKASSTSRYVEIKKPAHRMPAKKKPKKNRTAQLPAASAPVEAASEGASAAAGASGAVSPPEPDQSAGPEQGAPPKGTSVIPSGTKTDNDGAVSYKISFNANTDVMGQEGERRLAQVADTQSLYPMEKLNLVGYASADEANPEALAQNRVKKVSTLLVNKYNVNPARIQAEYKVVQSPSYEVDIYIVSGKE